MQDGTFKRERGHDERDTLHTRTFIIHVFKSKAVMYKSNECGTGQRHEQGKETTTDYYYYLHALIDSSTSGHGATTFTQKQKEDPLTGKGVDGVRRPL